MRIAVLQLPATWGEPERALAITEELLATGPRADLVLLPEASLTGYVSPELDFDLSRFAEPLDGPSARALSVLAKRYAVNLVAPLILRRDVALFNATVGFDPAGTLAFVYEKRHPWLPERWATPGGGPYPLVEIGERVVTVACCYDLHFVEHEASATLDAADLLLFPSAWVEADDSRLERLGVLAREHRTAVAAANWGSGLVRVPGQGGSAILDARGDVLAIVDPCGLRADAEV